MISKNDLAKLRDAKVHQHLLQYAPVWFAEETYNLVDHQLTFHAIFQHNLYGWVKRRYLYDGANDVLYHKGQVNIDDEAVMKIIEAEPAINATVTNIPNAYGG